MFEVTVKNQSLVPGYVMVPIYLKKPFAPVALANQQLVGMKKVFLNAHEHQVVTVAVDSQFLTFIDEQYQRQPLQGKLTFSTGPTDHPLMITKEI
jgi:hypothetical protein